MVRFGASGSIGAFWRDARGAVAVYGALTIAMMVGFAGLVLDVNRLVTTETELQYAADAAALAGAAELDGQNSAPRDALTRATEAARTAFVTNIQTFATGVADVDIPVANIRFFSALDADVVTTDPTAARFIEVTTEARTVNSLLIQVVGGPGSVAAQARAVAGFKQAVCRSTPTMMCNPNEVAGVPGATFDAAAWAGRQILLVQQTGSWGPGNFGFLQPSNPGASSLLNELATPNPTWCYGDRVHTQPGVINSFDRAINTRFDIYPTGGGSFTDKASYPPARNVTKGYDDSWTPNAGGNPTDDPLPANFMALPRDSNLTGGVRMGNGSWDRAGYWSFNHPATPSLPTALTNATRYQVYRYEIENNLIPNNFTGQPLATQGENGNPTKYQSATGNWPTNGCPNLSGMACANDANDVDRRRLSMAVVNCIEHNVQGNTPNLPVVDFVDLFMTEPVKPGSTQELVVEIIGPMGSGAYAIDGTMRDIVQLYR